MPGHGAAALVARSGDAVLQLAESTIAGQLQRDESALFDGVDTSIAGLAQFAGRAAAEGADRGARRDRDRGAERAEAFDSDNDDAALQPLLDRSPRGARRCAVSCRAMPIDDAARYEIDFRLRQKEREFQQAILLANSVRIEALADDGVVVPGQPVRCRLIVANRGAADVDGETGQVRGFEATARAR